MGLSRTFVGFSGTDIRDYRMMQAWKANNGMDFNFADCQIEKSIDSENEAYIKQICRKQIKTAGTFIQLIGQDTRNKHKYVRWEAEVALEKGCRIIGVNLDHSRKKTQLCPPIISDVGAVFVTFSPKIVQHALDDFSDEHVRGNLYYPDSVYRSLNL